MAVDDVKERLKAIEMAVGQIEKQFGKGAIMRLGAKGGVQPHEAISTGSISIDFGMPPALSRRSKLRSARGLPRR